MYRHYDDMYEFHDPDEGYDFVRMRLKEINDIVDMIGHVDDVDEIPNLIAELRSAAEKIESLNDEQLEEAESARVSGPDPDYEYDNRF